MNSRLLLLGAKGMAKEVIEAIELQEAEAGQKVFSEIALLDTYAEYDNIFTYPIIGKSDDVEKYKTEYSHAFVSITDPKARSVFIGKLLRTGFRVPNIIHPRAYVAKSVSLGIGIFVNACAAILPDSNIGDGCCINAAAVVSHDCVLGECVNMSPNSSTTGYVRIGDKTFVGVGASIINGKHIGKNVVIAAGAVVISDTPDNVLVAGCPATIKKHLEESYKVWTS